MGLSQGTYFDVLDIAALHMTDCVGRKYKQRSRTGTEGHINRGHHKRAYYSNFGGSRRRNQKAGDHQRADIRSRQALSPHGRPGGDPTPPFSETSKASKLRAHISGADGEPQKHSSHWNTVLRSGPGLAKEIPDRESRMQDSTRIEPNTEKKRESATRVASTSFLLAQLCSTQPSQGLVGCEPHRVPRRTPHQNSQERTQIPRETLLKHPITNSSPCVATKPFAA